MFGDSLLDVACPTCGAAVDKPCRTRGTGSACPVHASRRKHRQSAEGRAEVWNRRNPVGTPVVAFPGARPSVDECVTGLFTATRTEAWVLGGHTAVVMVKGYSACIATSHVDPR